MMLALGKRKRGRAVECTGLENRRGCEPIVSSNLTASAKIHPYGCFLLSIVFEKFYKIKGLFFSVFLNFLEFTKLLHRRRDK